MKYLKLIFILFLINGQIESLLYQSNYCKKEKNYSICEFYACGKKFCSNNKKSCDYFISIEIYLKGFTSKPDVRHKKFKAFIRNIKKCGSYDLKNQWSHRFSFG